MYSHVSFICVCYLPLLKTKDINIFPQSFTFILFFYDS